MKPWERYGVPLIVAALTAALVWVWCHHKSAGVVPVAEVRQKLANEMIEKVETKGKATRRAERAKVDKEVTDAARSSSLVEYTNSRRPR